MPAVSVVYTHELACATCGELLGTAGMRSIVKEKNGAIILFNDADPPMALIIFMICSQGHQTAIPKDFSFELAALSPKDAPAAARALATAGVTKSGKRFTL